MNEALMRRLQGHKDPRSKVGIYSRGKNIYNGGSKAARRGGGHNIGRPKKSVLQRRIERKKNGSV